MTVCPSCATELPEASRFCLSCGARLAAPAAAAEERKVVTTLFCDLVSFTAMSEAADPEDVDALLRTYHAAARKVIESHGGTVEKFIGDAVVGVFGVPAAHEDDPERAVRAGLRLVEALEGMARPDGSPLQVRVGVNTGEALVRLDVDPLSGRGFLTGDAVNVAARLQAAAPPGGVTVGATTHDLTTRVFDYEELPPISAKGKKEPLVARLARAPLARTGALLDRDRLTPLVGRDVELAYIRALFDKAVATATPQLAVIVGEPGIGKSRLVTELFAYADAQSQMTHWRQGRCLPYGEGVTFWALAEAVKAHAGILETDASAEAEAKLDAVVPEGPDRDWMVSRLRALVGLEAPQAGRDENFTAWLRFVEQVALAKPLVLVLEDLHWADEGLLAFVEYLATHADAVPLLVIGTARPELFEQQPTFAAGSTHINRISLDPLTREETERLVAGLVGGSEAWGQKVADIVDHCEGNPFFAEESAHLLADHVQTTKVPASVQAVVAARLDALPPVQKAVFGDAAVVGGVFWSGAVMALGRRQPAEVDAALRDLVGKQLVRRVRDSTMSGENEFAFAHALARDVAYGQLPRAVRAAKHAEVAAWLEAQFGDGLEDVSEVLAHHYVAGLELAEAVGKEELVEQLRRPAIEALHMAGKRALSLDAASAGRYLSRALDLAGPAGAERPRLLYLQAQVLESRGQWREEIACMEEAIPAARASGDVRLAGLAMKQLAGARDIVGDAGGRELVDDAVTMLEANGPSSELVELLAMQSAYALWAAERADPRLALRLGERAAAVSRDLGIPPSPAALGFHASALGYIGASGWEDEFSRAIESAKRANRSQMVSMLLFNRSVCIASQVGPSQALASLDEYRELADRVGAEAWQTDYRGAAAEANALLGRWDDASSEAHEMRSRAVGQDDLWRYLDSGSLEVLIMSFRGQTGGLQELAEAIETAAKDMVMVWQQAYGLLSAAVAHGALGRREVALGLAREWCSLGYRAYGDARSTLLFPQTMRGCASGGDIDLVRQLAATLEPAPTCNRLVIGIAEALVSEGSGDFSAAAAGFADAAKAWHDFGVPYEEGHALLGQGRCLVALSRAPEAAAPLTAAREIFARLGAKPALVETDALLAPLGAAGRS